MLGSILRPSIFLQSLGYGAWLFPYLAHFHVIARLAALTKAIVLLRGYMNVLLITPIYIVL